MEKICKKCGYKLIWENPIIKGRWHESADSYDGWDFCHPCMVGHCLATDCAACGLGRLPGCDWLDTKQNYMRDG